MAKGQKAMVALDILPMKEAEARERQATSELGIYGGKPLPEIFPEAVRGDARDQAGALAAIRDSKLYRDTHETFEGYCRDWPKSTDSLNAAYGSFIRLTRFRRGLLNLVQ